MAADYVFTSDSVTEGHPDKLCDQISDALVGAYLHQDHLARVIAECAVSTGILFVSVKASTAATVDVPNTAREVILDVGYHRGKFNGLNCTIMTNLSELYDPGPRADELELDDDAIDELVALDNVTVFGYACKQTPTLMPLPVCLAHRLVKQLDLVRKQDLDYLAPDGKCQVGIYFEDHKPRRVHRVTLVATQHKKKPSLEELRGDLIERVVKPVFAGEDIQPDAQTVIQINPEGAIKEGGPALHAGLTGRKNGVDTYGGYSRHGGAALSGKDPSRIDRIGAYAARHAAKCIVAAGLAEQCEVQLSYSLGEAKPVSVRVESFGSGHLPDEEMTDRITRHLDFRPGGIVRRFQLRSLASACEGEFYRRLAVYGHVGRTDLPTPWEDTSEAERLLEH